MRIVLKGLIGIGVFMFIGTAGASDFNKISFRHILLQIFISVAFIVLGYFGLEIIKIWQKSVRKTKRQQKAKLPQAACRLSSCF
jgi:hypothetical protein